MKTTTSTLLALGAVLLPIACGQVLGLGDFKDAPPHRASGGSGGTGGGSGGAAAGGEAGADQSGGSSGRGSGGTGGKSGGGSGGTSAQGGTGGKGSGGSGGGSGGTSGGAGGGSGGTSGSGGSSAGSGGSAGMLLSCTPAGDPYDVFTEFDLYTTPTPDHELDPNQLVVVPDGNRVHVGMTRDDGQYIARTLTDSDSPSSAPQVITNDPMGNYQINFGRVLAGNVELYGNHGGFAYRISVPLGSQGLNPGPANVNVTETPLEQPCPTSADITNMFFSFHGDQYSWVADCDDNSALTRDVNVYAPTATLPLFTAAQGSPGDAALRVQGYVYSGNTALLRLGDGGTMTLAALDFSDPAPTLDPFELSFGTGNGAIAWIAPNTTDDGAQIFAFLLNGVSLVPAHALWKIVDAASYDSLRYATPNDFNELREYDSTDQVGDYKLPSVGSWGTLFAEKLNDTQMLGFWVDPMGNPLLLDEPLYTAPLDPLIGDNVRLTHLGLATTLAIWLDKARVNPANPSSPFFNRVRAQRFLCSGT